MYCVGGASVEGHSDQVLGSSSFYTVRLQSTMFVLAMSFSLVDEHFWGSEYELNVVLEDSGGSFQGPFLGAFGFPVQRIVTYSAELWEIHVTP